MGRIFQNKLVGFHEYAAQYVCGEEIIYTDISIYGFSRRVPIKFEPKYSKPFADIVEEYDNLKSMGSPVGLSNYF